MSFSELINSRTLPEEEIIKEKCCFCSKEVIIHLSKIEALVFDSDKGVNENQIYREVSEVDGGDLYPYRNTSKTYCGLGLCHRDPDSKVFCHECLERIKNNKRLWKIYYAMSQELRNTQSKIKKVLWEINHLEEYKAEEKKLLETISELIEGKVA